MKKSFWTILIGAFVFGIVTACNTPAAPEKTLDSIAVTKNPTKTAYNVGEAFSLDGLEVTASYSDESKEIVTSDVTTSIAPNYVFVAADVSRNKAVTVTYERNENEIKTTTFSISVTRVYEKKLSSITITTPPTKLEYEVGDTLDLTGLVVTASFENGSQETLGKDDVVVTGFDSSAAATSQELTVSYTYENDTKTTSFNVTIKEKVQPVVTLTSIRVQHLPNKTEYNVGDTFSSEGLVIRANYSDESYKDLTEGFSLSPDLDGIKLTTPNSKLSISVNYQGKYTSFTVSVKVVEAQITGIRVATQPTKTEYEIGDEFESDGLKVEAVYDDGTTKDITNKVQLSGFDSSAAAESQTITVTYYEITDEYTTTFTVVIKAAEPGPGPEPEPGPTEKTLGSITVTTRPTKVEYEIGDQADYTGLVVTATYSDGTTAQITELNKFTITGFDSSAASDAQTITVSYTEGEVTKTATFTVKIKAAEPTPGPQPSQKTLSSIVVTTAPTKTTYDIGDQADYTGIVITASYSDDTTATITDLSKLTFNGFSTETSGQKTITVSYTEDGVTKTDTFNIGVNEPPVIVQELESITLAGPTKTTYTVGEDLDETGLVVTAHYTNGKADKVLQASDYTITGFNSNVAVESQIITVSYTEDEITKTATFTVKINPAPVVKHIVGFNSNGGSGVMASAEVEEGSTYRLPECTFTAPANKHFVGWLIGEETHAVGTTITVNADVDVKASWAWNDQVLQSIAVTTNPTKTTYEVGETFGVDGIVVTATYDFDKGTGLTKDVTASATYSISLEPAHAFDAGDIGEDQEVTVTYIENEVTKTATFTIDVYKAAGYYIEYIGSQKTPVKMATENLTDNNNTAEAINLPVENNDKFEIVYYDGTSLDGTTKISGLGTTYGYASLTEHAVTFDHVDNNGYRTGTQFNLYYKDDGTLYLADAKFNGYDGYYLTYGSEHYEFKEANKMSAGNGGNKAEVTLSLTNGTSFMVEHFVGSNGSIDTKEKNNTHTYEHFISSYSEKVFTVNETGKYKIMVGGDDAVYIEDADDGISSVSGLYVVYETSNYDVRQGDKLDSFVQGSNIAIANLDIAADTTIRVVYYNAVEDVTTGVFKINGVDYTLKQGIAQASATYLDTDVDSIELTFNTANNYDIYVNNVGEIHTAIGNYYTIRLDAGPWASECNTKIVFFTRPADLNQGSPTPYVYAWKGENNSGWQEMHYLKESNGEHLFWYEVSGDYEQVTFSVSNWQSVDITLGDDCTGYYYYKDNGNWSKYSDKYNVHTYTLAEYPARTGPHLFAWVWETAKTGRWVELTLAQDGKYEAVIHSYETNVIFGRFAYIPTGPNGEELSNTIKCWNKTPDQSTIFNEVNPKKGDSFTYKINDDWSLAGWQNQNP